MRIERLAVITSLAALLIVGWCAWRINALERRLGQFSSPELRVEARSDPSSVEQRLKRLEAGAPHLGEVMSGIQLHFAKLYFAGQARNWGLARFERGELEEGLNTVAELRPEENGVKLAGIIDAFKQTQMVALKDAIEMKDRSLFKDAYQEAIVMCNTCHQSTGRPFISIIVPTNAPVTNQRWEPPDYSP